MCGYVRDVSPSLVRARPNFSGRRNAIDAREIWGVAKKARRKSSQIPAHTRTDVNLAERTKKGIRPMLKEAKRPTLHLKQEKPTAEEAKAPEAPPPPAKPPNQLDVAEAFASHEPFGQRPGARPSAVLVGLQKIVDLGFAEPDQRCRNRMRAAPRSRSQAFPDPTRRSA
jgi:hypothetical protein